MVYANERERERESTMYGIDSVMTRWLQLALVSISRRAYLIYEALLMFVRCSLEYHLVLVAGYVSSMSCM